MSELSTAKSYFGFKAPYIEEAQEVMDQYHEIKQTDDITAARFIIETYRGIING